MVSKRQVSSSLEFPGSPSGRDSVFSLLRAQIRSLVRKLRSCKLLGRRRQWQPIPVLLPGKSHGWRSLVGCSPWHREESDTTERLHFHLSLSCIGEGNGNSLQCSCLENPRDWGARWAAVYRVAQSRKRLQRLSSSSSSKLIGVAGFPGGASGKEPSCQGRKQQRSGFDPWVGRISWRRVGQPAPVFLPGESPWTEEPGGYSPWSQEESDMTETT